MDDDKPLEAREEPKNILRAEPLAQRGLEIANRLQSRRYAEYTIVWQECGPGSDTSRRFYVPEYTGFLPFLMSGDDVAALSRGDRVELSEVKLLEGILYGLHSLDEEPQPWRRPQDKSTLLYLLTVLQAGFKCESQEKMILDVAANLRGRNGSKASRVVLEVGSKLVPQSSHIKSDLIMDLWAVASERSDVTDLLEEVLHLLPQIDLSAILPGAKEVVCYYGFCATFLLGRLDDLPQYLKRYVYPHVTNRVLKERIKTLIENPGGFSAADLKTVSGD